MMLSFKPRLSVFMHHWCRDCKRLFAETGVVLDECHEREHLPSAKQVQTENG